MASSWRGLWRILRWCVRVRRQRAPVNKTLDGQRPRRA
jgi:hypothetical protein